MNRKLYPHYHLVPKDMDKNLSYREGLIKFGASKPERAGELWTMCSQDYLFYVNSFVWTFDPRTPAKIIPFITYDFQDKTLKNLWAAMQSKKIENHDRLINKSRDMGASWLCLMSLEAPWHFSPAMEAFLVVSRNEDYVDKSGDPKSLFWKVDFVHNLTPKWLMPPINRSKLHLKNESTGSSLDGESTTGNVARGDRRKVILLDEFAAFDSEGKGYGGKANAATANATDCRIFNSTHLGVASEFNQILQEGKIHVISLHWTLHKEKAIGLYTSNEGVLKLLDEEYWADRGTDGYDFVLDGKKRSPWYDVMEARLRVPSKVAQELDMDCAGSEHPFFDLLSLSTLRNEFCVEPLTVGNLSYDEDICDPIKFTEHRKGLLSLWLVPDAQGVIPTERMYVIGIDVSTGSGASNSAASVVDKQTGEKVAEYANPFIDPENFARQVIALARWFNGAFLIWEANGPGRRFEKEILAQQYGCIYYRRDDKSVTKKVSDVPGWWAGTDEKAILLGRYRNALAKRTFINRSTTAMRECEQYINLPNSGVEHAGAHHSEDPTGARHNHGDRVIADALACKGVGEISVAHNLEEEIPVGSLIHRRRLAEQERAKEERFALMW